VDEVVEFRLVDLASIELVEAFADISSSARNCSWW
jgi:hypothetical protein